MDFEPCLIAKSDGVELRLFIQALSSRIHVKGLHGNEVKIQLTAPPVEGKANEELRRFLAKGLGLPLRMVELVSGEGSRHKRIMIKHKTLTEVQAFLLESLGKNFT
jgi:uncharacterized protein